MAGGERLDVVLNRLCLMRSRSEAKSACDADVVSVDGAIAKASQSVRAGQRVALEFPTRVLELRITELPAKSISKKAAREHYEVIRDEPRPLD